MKLGVYAICKNEVNNINTWYESVKTADYVCVLDTGSTDGTWEIIQSLPIISRQSIVDPWDFGKARTMAFQLLPEDTDICVHIDIDEYFSNDDWSYILKKEWKGIPQKIIYASVNKNIPVSTKYISHQYNTNIKWDYPIFEEPVIYGKDCKNFLWNYIENPAHYVENVMFIHNKDESKKRNYYNDLIIERIEFCISEASRGNIEDREKINRLFSLIESISQLTDKNLVYKYSSIIINILSKINIKDYKESYQKYLSLLCCGSLINDGSLIESELSDLEEFDFGIDFVSESIILGDSLYFSVRYKRDHLLNRLNELLKLYPLDNKFYKLYFTHRLLDSCRKSLELKGIECPKNIISSLNFIENKQVNMLKPLFKS